MKMQKNSEIMRGVVSRYCKEFPGQIATLVHDVDGRMQAQTRHSELISHLQNELHRLGGTAHCMGFKFLGRELESLLGELSELPVSDATACERELSGMLRRIDDIGRYRTDLTPGNSKLLNRQSALDDLIAAEQQGEPGLDVRKAKQRVLSRERILFADDDAFVRELIEKALVDLGAQELKSASSGAEVLKELESFQPTIIITDWKMQPINGLELLRKVRGNQTSIAPDTPIIFFTSVKNRQDKIQANRLGLNKLLPKPVLPESMVEAVLSIVEKKFHI